MYKKRKVQISRTMLKETLKQNGLNMRRLCKTLHLNYGTFLYCVEHGEIMPDYLGMIADHLHVSESFLKGES